MIFRNWVLQNFPFLEDDFDALTDYELFCKMIEYMKKAVAQLKIYDEKFIDFNERLTALENLDLQDEVNNKLDEMAEDGTLENLIGQYIELMTTYVYNSVAEMKEATNLVNGSFARTSGFYSYNDGGGSYYKIRNITTDDTVDEKFIISINDTLIAELIYKDELNILQLGAKENDDTATTLNTSIINDCFTKKIGVIIPKGTFYINTLNMTGWNKLKGVEYRKCYLKFNGSNSSNIINITNYGHEISKISLITADGLTNIDGIVFGEDNPAETFIEKCYIKVSGDGIKGGFNGHVNNVNIVECFIEECTNGINLQFYNYHQINAIYIKRNIINECTNAGILFYGNNVNIENNTLQVNKYGVLVGESGVDPSVYKEQDCENSNIINNYFEQNTNNPIYMNIGYSTGDDYRLIKNININNNFFHYTENSIYLNAINRNYDFSCVCDKEISTNDTSKLLGNIIGLYPKQNINELSNLPANVISNNNLKYYMNNQAFYNPVCYSNDDYVVYSEDTQTRVIIYTKLSKTKINNLKQKIMQTVADICINGYKDFGGSASFSFESKINGTGGRQYGNIIQITGFHSPVISPLVYFENNNKLSLDSDEENAGFQIIIRNEYLTNYNYLLNILANKNIAKGIFIQETIETTLDETADITGVTPTYIGQIIYDTTNSKWYYANTLSTWAECSQ